jgi:hypothetical protein
MIIFIKVLHKEFAGIYAGETPMPKSVPWRKAI